MASKSIGDFFKGGKPDWVGIIMNIVQFVTAVINYQTDKDYESRKLTRINEIVNDVGKCDDKIINIKIVLNEKRTIIRM